jgi:hypothetical protein
VAIELGLPGDELVVTAAAVEGVAPLSPPVTETEAVGVDVAAVEAAAVRSLLSEEPHAARETARNPVRRSGTERRAATREAIREA